MNTSSRQLFCEKCGTSINYSATQPEQFVVCPKCHEKNLLPLPAKISLTRADKLPPQDRKPCPGCGVEIKSSQVYCKTCAIARRSSFSPKWVLISLGVVAILGGIVFWIFRPSPTPLPAPIAAPVVVMNQPKAAPGPATPKSKDDLRPGKFTLEKKSNNLLIAVGDIENISNNLHTGLRVDLDVLDKNGEKIGTVSDYLTALVAHDTWHFLTPVKDANAAGLRFARLTEIRKDYTP